jgi:MarR family transcriptional regulator, 2-MHQ and catechol-resistance regulon repressor
MSGRNVDKELSLSTFVKLQRAAMTMERLIRARYPLPGNLSPTQFGVMEALLNRGRLSHHEVASKVLTTAGNITQVVEQLHKMGFVRRERCEEDRRRVYLVLTDRGRLIADQAFQRVQTAIVDAMDALTVSEREELGRLCKKLGTAVRYPPNEE